MQGYEIAIPKALLDYDDDSLKIMAMYISDIGNLSNQFLTRAGGTEDNYGDGPIDFTTRLPNPVIVPVSNLINTCSSIDSILVGRKESVLRNPDDAGLHSLRNVCGCVEQGDTITYDQPGMPLPTDSSFLTGPLYITENVVIKSLDETNRPRIFIDQNVTKKSIILSPGKTLTLDNVDLILINPVDHQTFSGPGTLLIRNKVEVRNE